MELLIKNKFRSHVPYSGVFGAQETDTSSLAYSLQDAITNACQLLQFGDTWSVNMCIH